MICVRLKGGLGNQMFQYATALALAEKNRTGVLLDLTLLQDTSPVKDMVYREFELAPFCLEQNLALENDIHVFHPPDNSILKRINNRLRRILSPPPVFIEQGHGYDASLMELPDPYCIVGSFQTEKYFLTIREKVLKAFSFRTPFDQQTETFALKLKSMNALCVHVRRGDYVSNPLFNRILGALSPDYYSESLNRLGQIRKIDEVFVFSDDIDWCRQNLKFDKKTTFVSKEIVPDNHHVHLYLMSQCSDFIISNSTFAWWAAWLSVCPGKEVFGPAKWFADGSRNSDDILCTGWQKI
jgi:hypothetical protein